MSEWDALVSESPQGHVFSTSAFLDSLGTPYRCYVTTTPSGEILAGAAILLSGSLMTKAPFPFTPHQGILFAKSVASLGQQKRLTAEFRITTFFIETLLDIFSYFSMALSPYFRDLRPFQWHNYGKNTLPQFEIVQRYTGHLSLFDFEINRYLCSVRTVRRQEYKKTQALIEPSNNLNLFLKLYQQTFDRQGIALDDQTLSLVKRICVKALAEGYGYLSCAMIDGCAASMAFFLTDQHCAYYLFGANDPDLRDANASSKLLIDNIASFATQNLKRFDFVGVNSPQRGDFKLSFNAELIPYQEVHLLSYG
jgi:hypothetical protein